MTQAKVIISATTVFVTTYSPYGATVIFKEEHNAPIEDVCYSDAAIRAKAKAFEYQNMVIVQEDATIQQVLDGKFNSRFM